MDSFLGALLLLPYVSSLPLSSPNDSEYTSVERSDLHRTSRVRVAALTCSSLSVAASLVAFYWFCRMDKRFRHQLIMLLVYGDLMRATWYFIFAVVSLAQGTVRTESSFCQSSGFLIRYGENTSDFAVLIIAVHSALQVLYSATQATSHGIYPYRRYVYAGALLIPSMMAGLAFTNADWGYLSQGAFCTLPIRPFWYRLALSWIPRYLIALIIIGLAIAIKVFVGIKFRNYSNMTRSIELLQGRKKSRALPGETFAEAAEGTSNIMERGSDLAPRASYTHDIASVQHRTSSVSLMDASSILNYPSVALGTCMRPNPGRPTSLPFECNDTVPSLLLVIRSSNLPNRPSVNLPIAPLPRTHVTPNNSLVRDPNLQQESKSCDHQRGFSGQMDRQHLHVRRQLRLLFIYPLVYILMWLIPFIHHCMMYYDEYAQRPPWFLRLGNTVCLGSMGLVNSFIFSLREKPWQNISTSDGTFVGSFAIRNSYARKGTTNGSSVTTCTEGCAPALLTSLTKHRRSANSDYYVRIAAKQASVRLELEREEQNAALRARIANSHKETGGMINMRHNEHGGPNEESQSESDGT